MKHRNKTKSRRGNMKRPRTFKLKANRRYYVGGTQI